LCNVKHAQESSAVRNPDRLSGLDASFLSLEEGRAHMHVGAVIVFEGEAPSYGEFVAHLERRLQLVPRYRQKLAFAPLVPWRPRWIDDPHFNTGYHVRHTALPEPAGREELRRLAGRIFSQELDRSKPLWEMWLVDRVEDGKFAIVSKTHHALVDGVSGVDVASVLFDLDAEPRKVGGGGHAWYPRPEPTGASLLAEAAAEIATAPLDLARQAIGALARPDQFARATRDLGGIAALAAAVTRAPGSPINQPIGPHRRFAWVHGDLEHFKAIKSALEGTVNDVVLTVVTGMLRSYYRAHGHITDDVTLRAMVPMSIRAEDERGALGNRVTAMYAPLPLYADDPVQRFEIVREAMHGLKDSGQAMGAEMITRLAGFAPPTVLNQAARLQSHQHLFNITVTNVPGPQFPLYMLGRPLEAIFPMVPLTRNTALGVAIMSYNGRIDFGLSADYDLMPDLDETAGFLEQAIEELARAAHVDLGRRNGRSKSRPRKPAASKR
jgi:WS/DGAT/MGAT family acyltransferase